MFTAILPGVTLFCVINKVVNALVVVEKTGGGVFPLNRTTAILWLPADASVGTNREVIVKLTGAVKKYPLTLGALVPDCGGMLIDTGLPGPLELGVTVTVATTGLAVALVAVNDAISPVPLAANPMDGSELVQLKTVPGTEPVKLTAAVAVLLHTAWLAGWATSGVGLTVTVAVTGVPVQLPATGVMVNVTVTGAAVVLVKVPLISPLPVAAIPVTVPVLSLVQLNVVPPTVPVSTMVVMGEPEQAVCDAGVATASGAAEKVRVIPVATLSVTAQASVKIQLYRPAVDALYVDALAPPMGAPSRYHW